MDRNATSAFLTNLLKSKSEPCYLLEFHFDDGVIYMSDAWTDIAFGGHVYSAQGHFLDFTGLKETFDLQIPTVNISLSAVDQRWIAIALSKQYVDRRVVIYKAFIDYVNGVVNAPLPILDGRLDSMGIADDPVKGTCTLAVSATNLWGDFQSTKGRHTNPNEQQVFFPGDMFFQFAGPINQQIKWGAP